MNLRILAGVSVLLGLLAPVSALAQGGDAVYRSLRLQTPLAREYMEPQGLQDSASDLLTANMNIMSNTYVTVMSGTVTVGEAGDAVQVHLTGQFGVMVSLYIVNSSTNRRLWRMSDPSNPGGATNLGSFPNGLQTPQGITSQGGALYIVDDNGDELWRMSDPTNPGGATNLGSFPSGLQTPQGITSQGGALYIVDGNGDELWRMSDPTNPGGATNLGSFPSGLQTLEGITSQGGALYIVDGNGDELWRMSDPTNPGGATNLGSFPSGLGTLRGIVSQGGALYIVDGSSGLWRISDPTNPGGATNLGDLPVQIDSPQGITSHVGMTPCMVRLTRGATEIEVVSFDSGRVLFDTTFTDAPPVGTHTYNLQVRTEQQNGCTAYRGDGTVPMPSMLVQSFYAGVIP